MAQPTREEILAEIDRLAAAKGINRDVLRQTIENESNFNPAAVGDNGQSFGLAQLYMGGGLGNTYEQQYGERPDRDKDWKRHLLFMADQIVSGGKGLEPWHGWKGDANAWQTGAQPTGQQPQQPSRGRGGQVMPPSQVTAGQPNKDEGLLAELRRLQEPQTQALSSVLLRKMGVGDPHSTRETTLAGLALDSLGFGKTPKEKLAEKSVKGVNEFSPTSDEDQVAANAARKRKPATLLSMFTGQQPAQAGVAQPTIGSRLFGPGGLFG